MNTCLLSHSDSHNDSHNAEDIQDDHGMEKSEDRTKIQIHTEVFKQPHTSGPHNSTPSSLSTHNLKKPYVGLSLNVTENVNRRTSVGHI